MVRAVDLPQRPIYPHFWTVLAMSGEGKGQDEGRGEITPEEREAIRRRSTEIGKQLDAVNARRVQNAGPSGPPKQSAYGMAFKFAAELIVGVLVGGAVGWFIDQKLGSAPWLMITFVILGFAGGLLNVIRAAQRAQMENEPLQRAGKSVRDEDEET